MFEEIALSGEEEEEELLTARGEVVAVVLGI
jgi:hypothetical protein